MHSARRTLSAHWPWWSMHLPPHIHASSQPAMTAGRGLFPLFHYPASPLFLLLLPVLLRPCLLACPPTCFVRAVACKIRTWTPSKYRVHAAHPERTGRDTRINSPLLSGTMFFGAYSTAHKIRSSLHLRARGVANISPHCHAHQISNIESLMRTKLLLVSRSASLPGSAMMSRHPEVI